MSLTKIPFIVLATWAFHMCVKRPNRNPPVPKHERIVSRVLLDNPTYTQWGPVITTALQWFAGIAEIATILASANPSLPISKAVLSLLVWTDGKPDNLYMSNAAAVGLILMVLGAWIRLMTYRHLGRFFLFEASIQKDHELIVSGPYSVVRHPSYTGLILVFTGWFPWQLGEGSWVMESGLWNTMLGKIIATSYSGIFILGTCYLLVRRMSNEDAALRNRFGKKWDEWAQRVPYSLFPGVY